MSNIKIFENKEFGKVRVSEIGGNPYFVGNDIATILGYKNTRDALLRHVDNEDKGVVKHDTLGGIQEITVINESGLYSLILSSKLPKAKEFKRWVTSEVLPSIRKSGGYIQNQENLTDNEIMAKALLVAQNVIKEKSKTLEVQRPKVLFAESVEASKTSILIGELAKILKQNGHEIGQNRLFEWLRVNNYLISRKGTDYNMPTQKSMNLGIFEIKETTITHADGHISISKTVKVTGKGQVYFINKFAG